MVKEKALPHALFVYDGNLTSHQFYNILADGQPKSRAAVLAT
jgi:hypothetical protein